MSGNSNAFRGPIRGQGGEVYPTGTNVDKMFTPSAGSGGGGGGYHTFNSFQGYDGTGGAGGSGGGFIDLTSNEDIRIFGTIDAAGSRGGNASNPYTTSFNSGGGGGGGGSGGGIRMLTPEDINITGATITAAGGVGGSATGNGPNSGGSGGLGRIVLEDGDSVITGLGSANLLPAEGATGFYRGGFDAARFQGGGLTPQVLTAVFNVGPRSPLYEDPVQDYSPGGQTDFIAAIPATGTRGFNRVAITIEARAFPMTADGEPDLSAGTGYYTIGYFADSGAEQFPTWVSGESAAWPTGDIGARPADNVGDGITNLNGRPFMQLRVTFHLPSTMGPFDPGPILDEWLIRFTFDQ
jgi:hypothetical protein